ncbi:phosphomevalonate kinase [Liquorilactobacillus oeni DSM 19972]|uniref:phosphomevalonate kinase n=1 Tax=Liquorilactobacillus oeni DSM 19972 TaxID=1423777 RepID=A0A0R1M7X2_9LACO|nr:phosphomevalonate kinase [Liquorilactobacillus oeni DSM 19972]
MKGHDFLITVKAPGKLYIAGEYAVVETGFPAILVALNQFVTVTVEESNDYGSINSKQYQENSLYWKREGNNMVFDNRDNPFHYILSAIRLTEIYAQSLNKEMKCYHLHIDSSLDSPDGKKYGLGSSAAVTVATIKALCRFYNLQMTKDKLFKLAAIAHLDIQGNGSLGDIAASVYGGWIAYRSFDRDWLKTARKIYSLRKLITLKWPALNIELLEPPSNLQLLIGWTGSPASTSHLVDAVSLKKTEQRVAYEQFLAESKACISRMITGFRSKSINIIQKEIRFNRHLLKNLGKLSTVEIETPLLHRLCDSAEAVNGAAKTSGAGGGDCGIVVIDKRLDTTELKRSWETAGIVPLNLHVHRVTD